MIDRTKVTPDCCVMWPEIASRLKWYQLVDSDRLAMPCVGNVRVNFCPSCGKDRRDCISMVTR